MSIDGLQVIQMTNRYTVTRVGGRHLTYRQCWVRGVNGVELVEIRTDLLDES